MSDTMMEIKPEMRTVCPICLRPPHLWRETAKHGSRVLYWVGCRIDGKLVGAVQRGVAIQLWDRLVLRMKFETEAKNKQ